LDREPEPVDIPVLDIPIFDIPIFDIPIAARIESYKIVVENLERFASRRQLANNVFVSLNTVFLTAIGVFISTHLSALNSWSGTIALLVIAIAITPINVLWLFALNRYVLGDEARYRYRVELESKLPTATGIGFYNNLLGKGQMWNFLP
jgi:hypothetical protein